MSGHSHHSRARRRRLALGLLFWIAVGLGTAYLAAQQMGGPYRDPPAQWLMKKP